MNRNPWMVVTLIGAFAVAVVGWSVPAVAQMQQQQDSQPSAAVPGAPDKIAGTVTAVDTQGGTVTLKGSDGQTHSFRGSPDTLKDLKVGDKLELSKRAK